MTDFNQVIQTIAVYAIPVLFAISLHEAAHGYVARYFGDTTAEQQGRLSLNPIHHIDWFGTVLLPIMLALSPLHMAFGYAKPVPVDYSRLRNPKKQMGFVAAAGPAANFVMGLAWTVALVLMYRLDVQEPFLIEMGKAGMLTNAVMCVFNLIPVPPLDGGRIVTALLPNDLAYKFAKIERYGPYVFIGLLVLMYTGILSPILAVMVQACHSLFITLVLPLRMLLG
jgi:Zn-dependent protease